MRSAKTVGGSTKYFVYNGSRIVFEYEGSISNGTIYYYGLNRTHNSNGEIYVYNAHGDTVQLVKNNAVVVSYTYDAFGNLTSQVGESDNPFLYCSEYFDSETQTYYLRARYYNPANGRFTQQDAWAFMDTGDPLSLNLYTYCTNNPIMYVDPSGHDGAIALYEDSAMGFGHISALFQDDEGIWRLVYWGGQGSALDKVSPMGTTAYMEFFELGTGSFDSLDSLKAFLKEKNKAYIDSGETSLDWTEGLTDFIYFDGDFSESVSSAQTLYDNQEEYNLYTNNCMQVSLSLLSKGAFENHDKAYKKAIEKAKRIAIPNNAFPGLKYFSDNVGAYAKASLGERLKMGSPYKRLDMEYTVGITVYTVTSATIAFWTAKKVMRPLAPPIL